MIAHHSHIKSGTREQENHVLLQLLSENRALADALWSFERAAHTLSSVNHTTTLKAWQEIITRITLLRQGLNHVEKEIKRKFKRPEPLKIVALEQKHYHCMEHWWQLQRDVLNLDLN